MSNIHFLGDNEGEDINELSDKKNIFSKAVYRGNPREQSLFSFIKEVFFPFFRLKSFSFIIIIINTIFFMISLIPHGLDPKLKNISFLPPSAKILSFGCLFAEEMRGSFLQSHRWITNGLLHENFEDLFLGSILIMNYSLLEYLIGSQKFCLIYIISGIFGSLFVLLIKSNIKYVGASISIYGIIGALLGFCLINKDSLEEIFGEIKKIFISFMSMIILLDLVNYSTRVIPHFGGAIFGFFLSLCLIKPEKERNTFSKILFYIGLFICILFPILGFSYFYGLKHILLLKIIIL